MHIAIDARMMGAEQTRGIGRYIAEIVKALKQTQPHWQYTLLQPAIPWYGWREQLEMPKVIKAVKADHVWFPHWNVPLSYRGDFSITIHDLLLMHQPKSAKASTRHPFVAWIKHLGFRVILRNAIKKAKIIFVPTEAVKQDIIAFFPSTKEKIVVNGEGLTDLPQVQERSVSSSPFLFYVGSAYPHKRLDLLLFAWERIAARHPNLSLIIAGESDVFMKKIQSQSQSRRLPRVSFVGRLSDQELVQYYAQATAFVFPTSFEGFGLPPCEALSLGCPVVSSDIRVLKEVLPTEGVFFFENGSVDGMIEAIETVLVQGLKARTQALLGGAEVRQRHRWANAAQAMISSFQSP